MAACLELPALRTGERKDEPETVRAPAPRPRLRFRLVPFTAEGESWAGHAQLVGIALEPVPAESETQSGD